MRRVLIPSNNRDFVAHLAAAYRRQGWDAVVGVSNFDLHTAGYDIVHLQWPEELTGWEPPSAEEVAAIARSLDHWKKSGARLVLTVHNLYPHRHKGDHRYRVLFETIYDRVPTLAHFTEASRQLVTAEFPMAANRQNIVTGFFNFDDLLPRNRAPEEARQKLGIAPGEFVLLSFGMLRDWAEVELIREAFDAANVPKKRLLMAGRYQEFGPVWRQRWRRWSWNAWLRSRRAIVVEGFVPDAEVHCLADAADAVLIPRIDVLNSGLVGLAATFGKIFIAPDCAGFPELAAGTQNPPYRTGDATDLAIAIEKASTLDRAAMALQNRALADAWNWDSMVSRVLHSMGFA